MGKKLYYAECLGCSRIKIFLNPRAIADTSKSWPTLPTECISYGITFAGRPLPCLEIRSIISFP